MAIAEIKLTHWQSKRMGIFSGTFEYVDESDGGRTSYVVICHHEVVGSTASSVLITYGGPKADLVMSAVSRLLKYPTWEIAEFDRSDVERLINLDDIGEQYGLT